RKCRVAVGVDDDDAAGKALRGVVVGVAFEAERNSARHERAEALAGRAAQVDADRVVRQSFAAPALRDLGAELRADGAVRVAHARLDGDGRAVGDGVGGLLNEDAVERALEAVILAARLEAALALVGVLRLRKDRREVEAGGLP